jgi:hypothetical protein
MQTTVAPASGNRKDYTNIITAHNSRNKIDNRTTNTVWMPEKAGMLLKVLSSEMDPAEIRLIR